MRKIRIASTAFDLPKTIETDVKTWGELQEVLTNNDISYVNMTATLSPTNVNLEREDAVIPDGEVILFLSPTKVNSGAENMFNMTEAQLEEETYNALRSFASRNDVGLEGNPSKLEIIKRIYTKGTFDPNREEVDVNDEEMSEAEIGFRDTLLEIRTLCNNALNMVDEFIEEFEEVVEEKSVEPEVSEEDKALMEQFQNFQNS